MIRNTSDLIKAGKLIAVGLDYVTDDGRTIKRVYLGKRGTLKWKVEGDTFPYRNLFDAYYGNHNK